MAWAITGLFPQPIKSVGKEKKINKLKNETNITENERSVAWNLNEIREWHKKERNPRDILQPKARKKKKKRKKKSKKKKKKKKKGGQKKRKGPSLET